MHSDLGYYVPLRESGPSRGADRNQFGELEKSAPGVCKNACEPARTLV